MGLPRTALLAGDHADLTTEGAFHSTFGSRRRRFLASIQRVTTGKLCLSAAALAGARGCLTIAVRYAHRRHTFAPASRSGVPVFAYRCHQTRLLGATAQGYAATFLLREATRRSAGPDAVESAEAEVLVAAAKGWITWQARDIVVECRERCGAQGLLSANRIVDLLTPIESTITAEGDNLVIWTKAGADMLIGRGYRPPATAHRTKRPADRLPAPAGPARPARAALLPVRAQPPQPHRHQPDGPLEPRGEPGPGPRRRVRHPARRPGIPGRAQRVGDNATRSVLEQLFQLFALQRLAPHAGPLLADGHLTAEAVRDLSAAIDRVGAALAPHALTLVEAFAIPDAILQAPIATDGYDAAYDDPGGPWQQVPVS